MRGPEGENPYEEPRVAQIAKILSKLDLIDQSLLWWALFCGDPAWGETKQFEAYKNAVIKQHPDPDAVFEELKRRYQSN